MHSYTCIHIANSYRRRHYKEYQQEVNEIYNNLIQQKKQKQKTNKTLIKAVD